MYKQVIVIRGDLKLSRGKLAAQVAHAALDSYKAADRKTRDAWEQEGAKKVVVEVPDLKALGDIKKKAAQAGLPLALIRDAGRTEIPPGTVTCLGIGPEEDKKIDKVTGKLKVL